MSLARLGDVRRLVSVGPRLPAVAVARLHAVGLAYLGVGGVMSGVLLVVMLLTPAGEVVQKVVRAPLDQVLELLAAPMPPPQPVATAEPSPPSELVTAEPEQVAPAPELPLPLGEGGGEGAASPPAPTPAPQAGNEAALAEQPAEALAPELQTVPADLQTQARPLPRWACP